MKRGELPEDFKLETCKKCGKTYGYAGLDFGYCVSCLDEMEEVDE